MARRKEWISAVSAWQAALPNTVNTSIVINSLVVDQARVDSTIIRMVGRVRVQLQQENPVGFATGAWGFVVRQVSQAGDTVTYAPVDDGDTTWMLWQPFGLLSATPDSDTWVMDWGFDTKVARKLEDKTELVFMIQNDAAVNQPIDWWYGVRILTLQ